MTADAGRGYRRCAELTRHYGTTYYWGARLLPPDQRRDVFAVYALCRLADDIVDGTGATTSAQVEQTRVRLDAFESAFFDAWQHGTDDDLLAAITATVRSAAMPAEYFERFFGAMRQDLTVTSYRTWDDLVGYMEGSAAVIGEMMVPVLRAEAPGAIEPARSLGFAFQLTNFLRDIGEDLNRGRVYMPAEDLARFGVDITRRTVDEQWREFMRFQIRRNRALYEHADTGLALMPRRSARCVAVARVLYSGILTRIEQRDYDVFSGRARVALPAKMLTAARGLISRRPDVWGSR